MCLIYICLPLVDDVPPVEAQQYVGEGVARLPGETLPVPYANVHGTD
jgi:hypothetical protein